MQRDGAHTWLWKIPGLSWTRPCFRPAAEKKAYYAQGEGEVHAVVALDIHAMEPQPLGAHGCQREEEARQRQLLVPPPSGGPKQKEQWREEQAIAV